ncbi:MAG TPA: hypothetical protein VHL52_10030 [Acidimicrobiia bacterium]|nr:hypothetical protein [Acidimicrobiia bacterium]
MSSTVVDVVELVDDVDVVELVVDVDVVELVEVVVELVLVEVEVVELVDVVELLVVVGAVVVVDEVEVVDDVLVGAVVVVVEVVVEVVGGGVADRPRARTRKAAICPRVTGSSGQNRSLSGGLHPRVTPVAPSHSMSASNTDALSSPNSTASWGVRTSSRAR